MSLSRIIGHEQAKRLLMRAFVEGRVPTAYLFVGPSNLGKFTVAVEFAKLLNCEAPVTPSSGEGADCCDVCEACRRIEAGSFADVLCVRPVIRIGSGAQAQATEFEGALLTTDQIGEVITRASLRRTRGRHKVFIIARAETMNPEAANRLLKTLEEPPEGTLLILTSSNPSALLPTIVSRCQRVTFHAVPLATLAAGLRTEVPDASDELVDTIARLSSGRPGWALTLLRKPRALDVRRRLLDLVASLPGQPLVAALALGEELIGLSEAWWRAINEGDE
ncbi:MAG: DNA polymerase III subunit, partial [Armatimonadetes bacterium]|nr:DNA polymerase III subunit [Armatimonadota bacterium]